jgi:integrase
MGVAVVSYRKRKWTTAKGEEREGWSCDYRDQHGNRVVKLFKTRKEAAAYHAKVTTEVNEGVHTAPSRSITVKQAAADWIQFVEGEGRERGTIFGYHQHVNLHIVPRIGALKLGHLNTPRIQKFRDDLLVDLSRPMAKKILSSLKSLLKDAKRRGNVAQNVASDVSITMDSRHKRKLKVGEDIPTPEEIKRLVGALGEGRWRVLILTAIFAGLRASELRGLRWRDVDLHKGELHVRQRADRWGNIGKPKSRAGERTVPIPPLALNALREWRISRRVKDGEELVFSNSKGRVESYANIISRGLVPAMKAAGVVGKDGKAKYTGLHALRHFYASWCINRRADGGLELPLKTVQARLGHSSIMMTADTYGHLFPRIDDGKELEEAEKKLLGLHVT